MRRIKQSTFIFNFIAICLVMGVIYLYQIFEQTKKNIISINYNSNVEYIDNVTNNISLNLKKYIDANFYDTLKNNKNLREFLEEKLRFFVTKRYRYIYIVDKEDLDSDEFRFLLDGSLKSDERSEFGELYFPIDIEKWDKAYKGKETIIIEHNDIKSLWMTYLKPIIVNDKVEALIVIDFSLNEHKTIEFALYDLNKLFDMSLFFTILIFVTILIFSYIDNKREKQKDNLYERLQKRTQELYLESLKVQDLNQNLENKVKEEVEKNREKEKQLLHQSRLAQMGEMISMIAHQWRQPLTAISSTSSSINIKAKISEIDKEFIIEQSENILRYTSYLSSTIDDFRNFFKSNKEKSTTNFDELITSVTGIIQISLNNKNISLLQDLKCHENFTTYANEMRQVILNLVKNAEDVLIEKEIQIPYIKIETTQNEKYYQLIVSDNAGGIPVEIIDKIFDPYFSTKTQKDGTGLGLYMSKTIIEEHCNGKLTVTNDEDGAVFCIWLNKEGI